MFDALPAHIQRIAEAAFLAFSEDSSRPSLRLHALNDGGRGRHKKSSFSVSITRDYRAIYTVVENTNVWYWVGSHADADTFTGR